MILELDGQPFAVGVATYLDVHPKRARGNTAIYIGVILSIAGGVEVLALLDTGAPYCILSPDLSEQLGLRPTPGAEVTINTRRGPISGYLHRIDITIPAEIGETLVIDATVFAPSQWEDGEFLGYSGFLERMNFAIQPSQYKFYFGQPT